MKAAKGSGKGWFLWVAGLVVLLSSGLALAHAAWNRLGDPRAVLELTERELHPDHFESPDETGLSLQLAWQALDTEISEGVWSEIRGLPYLLASTQPVWLDPDLLGELGFDLSVPLDDPGAARHYNRILPRRVFVAYEMEGETWQWYLSAVRKGLEHCREREDEPKKCPDADEARRRLQRIQRQESRLFAIDAAREAKTLLDRYAHRSEVAVLPAYADIVYRSRKDDKEPEIRGILRSPEVSELHVPLPWKRKLEPWLEKPSPWEGKSAPRFRARVAWGRGFEPWLVEVAPFPAEEPDTAAESEPHEIDRPPEPPEDSESGS